MAKYIVNAANKTAPIQREVYGHFSEHLGRCIYQGLYVGENSPIENMNGMRKAAVDALKQIRIPMLRWPGGCFADEYHWMDGIGAKEGRKKMINTHWGGVVEDNSFGTHEFMELCRQLECEPYINGNVGSGTVREMSEWMEYLTFDGVSPMAQLRAQNGHKDAWKVKYFAVGNENWGCGGNMRPEYYADEYRRYQTYVRNYGDNKVFRVACGANRDDYNWTKVLMERAGNFMDGLSLHYYTVPYAWEHKGAATGFSREDWYVTLQKAAHIDELITKHAAIMDKTDPAKRVAMVVDEWGTWFDVEPGTNPGFLYQQNTMRDALVAAITLNIFNKHADRVRMACLAQTVNVLQAVLLTDGEKIVRTPTFHVFDLYKAHQGADAVESYIENTLVGIDDAKVPALTESASIAADGTLTLTLGNLSMDAEAPIDAELLGYAPKSVSARILNAAPGAHNTFDAPEAVKPAPFTAIQLNGNKLSFTLPANAVIEITVK